MNTYDPNPHFKALTEIRPLLLRVKTDFCREIAVISASYLVPIISVTAYALRSDVWGEREDVRASLLSLLENAKYKGIAEWRKP
jgi:hypothetical protein